MTTDEITVKIDADGVPVEATGATPEEAAAAAVEAYKQLTDEDENDTSHLPDLPDLPDTDPVEISPPRRPSPPHPSPPTDPFGSHWWVDMHTWSSDDNSVLADLRKNVLLLNDDAQTSTDHWHF